MSNDLSYPYCNFNVFMNTSWSFEITILTNELNDASPNWVFSRVVIYLNSLSGFFSGFCCSHRIIWEEGDNIFQHISWISSILDEQIQTYQSTFKIILDSVQKCHLVRISGYQPLKRVANHGEGDGSPREVDNVGIFRFHQYLLLRACLIIMRYCLIIMNYCLITILIGTAS